MINKPSAFFYLFCVSVFTFFNCPLTYARVGLAEIIFTTPGGHTICHCDPYPDKLTQLEKWYFYHNTIVGKGKNYYFIFDEGKEQLQLFDHQEQWQRALEKQQLKPFFTRWLDLSDSPDSFLFFLFLTSFVSVPFVFLLFVVLLFLTIKKKIAWNKKALFVSSGIIVFIALSVLSALYVQSF